MSICDVDRETSEGIVDIRDSRASARQVYKLVSFPCSQYLMFPHHPRRRRDRLGGVGALLTKIEGSLVGVMFFVRRGGTFCRSTRPRLGRSASLPMRRMMPGLQPASSERSARIVREAARVWINCREIFRLVWGTVGCRKRKSRDLST